ncbi:putative sodium-coupled neutral amino acid transporter 6 [Collichthys lucidus]|uniref:Putative sodium-coupled neutral amino acid transporter 6 n=1 Tax=Collichthys lucidus TaxID=240159 RepID=A0A4U5VF20_COLLU|nr:putative sodium-coupled neutral amino acid transporter 6 [Collichthys lucidus]
MGSGILGLAYAMANTGIVGFCILLIIVSCLAAYSIHLLLKLCDQTGINSYENLGGKALQKPGKVLVGITIIIQNIGGKSAVQLHTLFLTFVGRKTDFVVSKKHSGEEGAECRQAMSSYLFILKSELPAAISSFLSPDSTGPEGGNVFMIEGHSSSVISGPCLSLAYVDEPAALSPSQRRQKRCRRTDKSISAYGNATAVKLPNRGQWVLMWSEQIVVKKWSIPCPLPHNVTTFSGAFQISNSSDSECTPKLFVISSKSAYAIPTMAFSFLCHTAILPIYCELDRPTKTRMQNVTNVSIGLSFLVYLISAMFGYLTFYCKPAVTHFTEASSPCHICCNPLLHSHLPLIAHVDTELLLGYGKYLPRDIMARKAAILLLCGGRPFSWLIHIISTLTILGVVLLLAIFVPDISSVFGIVGCIPGGVWFVCGTRQLGCHYPHMGAGLLTPLWQQNTGGTRLLLLIEGIRHSLAPPALQRAAAARSSRSLKGGSPVQEISLPSILCTEGHSHETTTTISIECTVYLQTYHQKNVQNIKLESTCSAEE